MQSKSFHWLSHHVMSHYIMLYKCGKRTHNFNVDLYFILVLYIYSIFFFLHFYSIRACGYEMIIANSALCCAAGIIVKYSPF